MTHAIEGSVRRADWRIRITAQLVQVNDHSHVWSERYDRDVDDVFAIHDDIADAIARRLQLTPPRLLRRAAAPTANRDAHDRFIGKAGITSREERRTASRARAAVLQRSYQIPDPDRVGTRRTVGALLGTWAFTVFSFGKDAFASAVWESLRALE